MNSDKISRFIYYIIFFLFLNLALRSYSFSLSVIDHDESTYILAGKTIYEGGLLYKDVIDGKPPGIFIIYYLNTFLFNDLIFGFRVMGWIAVSLTATLLCLFMKNFFRLPISEGIFTGIIFSMMMCYSFPGNINLTTYALEVNTEHFYILFLLISFIFIIRKKSLLDFGIGGLCCGIAFNISFAAFPHLIALSNVCIYFLGLASLSFCSRSSYRVGKIGSSASLSLSRALINTSANGNPFILLLLRINRAIDFLSKSLSPHTYSHNT